MAVNSNYPKPRQIRDASLFAEDRVTGLPPLPQCAPRGETLPDFVPLDRAGKEAFRHVGRNNGDRLGFDQLAAKVAELKAAKP